MRNTMRVLTLVMALAMLLTLAVSVSAVNFGNPAGAYGYIHGLQVFQTNYLKTTTTVTANPDAAKLYISVDFKNAAGDLLGTSTKNSTSGVTKYEEYHYFQSYISDLTIAFTCHEVRGASGFYDYYASKTYTG